MTRCINRNEDQTGFGSVVKLLICRVQLSNAMSTLRDNVIIGQFIPWQRNNVCNVMLTFLPYDHRIERDSVLWTKTSAHPYPQMGARQTFSCSEPADSLTRHLNTRAAAVLGSATAGSSPQRPSPAQPSPALACSFMKGLATVVKGK